MVKARPPYVVETRLSYVVEMAEDLDIILNDPADLRRWILMDDSM